MERSPLGDVERSSGPVTPGRRPGSDGAASVVVADDDGNVRVALAALLDDHPRLRVVGQAGSGGHAASLCAVHRPSLAVVDVAMPEGGDAAIRAVLTVSPSTIVAVYTARSDRPTHERMIAAGAAAVFVKGGTADLAAELAALCDAGR